MSKHTLSTNFSLIQVKGEAGLALLQELAAESYEGPLTRAVRDQLWLYGWVCLRASLSDGSIAGLGYGPGAREITARHLEQFEIQSTRDELAVTTLEKAVPKFMTNLAKGRYDPFRATTIATFFLSYALRRLRTDVIPRWADDLARRNFELGQLHIWEEWSAPDVTAHLAVPDHATDVVDYLAVYRAAAKALKNAPIEQRLVVLGVLRGKTHLEIATELGVTPKVVEHRLAAFRKRSWKYRPEAEHGVGDGSDDWTPTTHFGRLAAGDRVHTARQFTRTHHVER